MIMHSKLSSLDDEFHEDLDGGNNSEPEPPPDDDEGSNNTNGNGGTGGGDGANEGGEEDDENEQDNEDDEEEQPTTPSTNSSSNSATGSLPELVRPPVTTQMPPRQPHPQGEHQGDSDIVIVEPPAIPGSGVDNAIVLSESEGGISDAPTAIISDTEGRGQVIYHGPRSEHSLSSPDVTLYQGTSPRGASPRGAGHAAGLSSAMSTLSSFTSSSDSGDKDTSGMRPPMKRPPGKLVQGASKRTKPGSDLSSESDLTSATTATTSTKTSTTTSDTSGDRSHDTSGDRSHDTSGDQSHDNSDEGHNNPPSQQDMFGDEQDMNRDEEGPSDVISVADIVCTPAEKLGSLSFSGESLLVHGSMDEGSLSQSIIPPSKDAYDPAPHLMANSPTGDGIGSQSSLLSAAAERDYSKNSPAPSEARSTRAKSTSTSSSSLQPSGLSSQQWQQTWLVDSYKLKGASSSNSRSTSKSTSRSTSKSPEESDSVEILNVENTESLGLGSSKTCYKASPRKTHVSPLVHSNRSQKFSSSERTLTATSMSPRISTLRSSGQRSLELSDSQSFRKKTSRPQSPLIASQEHLRSPFHNSQSESRSPRSLRSGGFEAGTWESTSESGSSHSSLQVTVIHQENTDCEMQQEENDPEGCLDEKYGTSQDLALRFSQSQMESQFAEGTDVQSQKVSHSRKTVQGHALEGNEDHTESRSSETPGYHLSLPKSSSLQSQEVMAPPDLQLHGNMKKCDKDPVDNNNDIVTKVVVIEPPSLTIDMIDTVLEEANSERSGPCFKLDRPTIDSVMECVADTPETTVSVFKKAQAMKEKKRLTPRKGSSNSSNSGDPFEFSGAQDISTRISLTGKLKKPIKDNVKKSHSAKKTPGRKVSPIHKDSMKKSSSPRKASSTPKREVISPPVETRTEETIYELDTEMQDTEEVEGVDSVGQDPVQAGDSMTLEYDYTLLRDKELEQPSQTQETVKVHQEQVENPQSQKGGKFAMISAAVDPGPSSVHYQDEAGTPKSWHSQPVQSASRKSVTSRTGNVTEGGGGSDPYEYHLSQSQKDQESRAQVMQLAEQAKVKAKNRKTQLSQKKPAMSSVIKESTKTRVQEVIPDKSGLLRESNSLLSSRETSSFLSGHSYRTITIKTVYCHTVTVREERVSGQTTSSSIVNQTTECLSHTINSSEDSMSTPPSQNTRQSLSSGNLGDISSIERSSGLSRPGSTLTSPHEGLTVDHSTSATSASLSLSKSTSSAGMTSLEVRNQGVKVKKSPGIKKGSGRGQSRTVSATMPVTTQGKNTDCTQQLGIQRQDSTDVNCVSKRDNTSSASRNHAHDQPLTGGKISKKNNKSGVSQKSLKFTQDENPATSSVSPQKHAISMQQKSLTSSVLDPIPRLDTSPNILYTSDTIPCGQVGRSSISSLTASESLFSNRSENAQLSSDVSKTSASLFSNISDGDIRVHAVADAAALPPGVESDDHIFAKPKAPDAHGAPTRRSSGKFLEQVESVIPVHTQFQQTTDASNDEPNMIIRSETETESETAIPDTDIETQVRKLEASKRLRLSISRPSPSKSKAEIQKDAEYLRSCRQIMDEDGKREGLTPNQKLVEQDGDISPEIPLTGRISQPPIFEPTDVVPSSLNTKDLETGTPVLAMWRDKYYYPGHVVLATKNKYSIHFEDGDTRQAKATDLIVCDLLPKGQEVMASDDNSDFEVGVVAQLACQGKKRGCMIKFSDDKTTFVPRGQVMLNPSQAADFKQNIDVESSSKESETMDSHHSIDQVNVVADSNNPKHSKFNVKSKPVKSKVKGQYSRSSVKNQSSSSTQESSSKKGKKVICHVEQTDNSEVASPKSEQMENYYPFEPYLPVSAMISANTPVLAMWRDKHFYPGVVSSREEGSDKFNIQFDDGDLCAVKECDVIICEMVNVRQSVFAERHDEGHEAGVVCGHYRQGHDLGYTVEFSDQKQERVPRGHVILQHVQARAMMSEIRGSSSTPHNTSGDLTLDNLIDGKRKRGSKMDTLPSPLTQSDAATGSSKKQSTAKKSGAKRKHLEPKATSTPTPKRRLVESHRDSVPSPLDKLKDSPQMRRSPRKSKLELFPPGPASPMTCHVSQIFQGLTFLLTHVDKSSNQLQPVLDAGSSTDESSIIEEEAVPFDKDFIAQQIIASGGIILEQFDRSKVMAAKCCYLISNTCHRTLKYFSSLAAGLACVSYVWIIDACRIGHCPDIKAYLLPSGVNIENNKLSEWSNSCGDLQGLTVYVTSENVNFVTLWKPVLQASPCNLIDKLPPPAKAKLSKVHVISDSLCSSQMAARVHDLGLVHLSSEWIIQCLVQGRRVSHTGHPKYQWDHKE